MIIGKSETYKETIKVPVSYRYRSPVWPPYTSSTPWYEYCTVWVLRLRQWGAVTNHESNRPLPFPPHITICTNRSVRF